jgi:hypothetical protein
MAHADRVRQRVTGVDLAPGIEGYAAPGPIAKGIDAERAEITRAVQGLSDTRDLRA